MKFSNKCIRPIREDKPHIVKVQGYWRVSPLESVNIRKHMKRWQLAHQYAGKLNSGVSCNDIRSN